LGVNLVWFGIVTLFPEMFEALQVGITGRAQKNKLLTIACWNPRNYSTDKHQSVDDHPYGGGPGMVMMAEPLAAAIQAAIDAAPTPAKVIYLSPQGRMFNQEAAQQLSTHESIIFLAGRYEGIDERVITTLVDEEWSIGDYILTGGELAAMAMIDTITRLIPGAVGDENSVSQDSLTTGLLKYPQYTRPETALGMTVPDELLSGHHQRIYRYRLKASLGKTWLRRPDLIAKRQLSTEEQMLLDEFIQEVKK
jgi:tRNA (guanine37-N1)-methyltransferase